MLVILFFARQGKTLFERDKLTMDIGKFHRQRITAAVVPKIAAGSSDPIPHRSVMASSMLTDYAARWVVIGVCALVALAWCLALHIAVDIGSVLPVLEAVGLLLFFATVYAGIGKRAPRFSTPLAVVTDFCLSLAQLLAAIAVLMPLTYLAATPGFPLLDDQLARLDAMFGFDWDTAAAWVDERPTIDWLFQHAYFSIRYQALAILLIGSFWRDRNGEVLWLFIGSLLITCAIFAFTPAAGKVGHLGTGYLDLLMEIRRGDWTVMTYERNEGLISFPSFHTTIAILLTYVARHRRWTLAVLAPLNSLMIISIPTVGGHYLVDVFGGAAVAGLAILLVRLLRRPSQTL
jgi:membrane-associated phospholipid phosphatase